MSKISSDVDDCEMLSRFSPSALNLIAGYINRNPGLTVKDAIRRYEKRRNSNNKAAKKSREKRRKREAKLQMKIVELRAYSLENLTKVKTFDQAKELITNIIEQLENFEELFNQ